jgi:hypothetical protein
MAININTESVITLAQAAALLPHLRRGKPPHVASLYRWATRGLRGVRLETLRVGGTVCTSKEALQRFFQALNATASVADGAHVTLRPRRRLETVRERLRRAGF